MKVSIMIPNYNGKGLLEENLPYAFAALRQAGCEGELVVADDASTDDSCRFIREHHPDCILIEASENLGFAGNCNRGIRVCRGEWVLVLNSDVKLAPDYLKILLAFARGESVFGLSGSIYPDNGGPISDGGKFPAWNGIMLNTTLNYEVLEPEGNAFPALFLSGAAALIHAEKFRELGGFQELFNPYYFEDAEIGLMAWRNGWASLYVPDARCFHRISSTIGKNTGKEKVRIIARRNKFLMHAIHLGGWRRLIWQISLLIPAMMGLLLPDSRMGKSYREYLLRRTAAWKRRNFIEQIPGIKPLEQVVKEIRQDLSGKIKRIF